MSTRYHCPLHQFQGRVMIVKPSLACLGLLAVSVAMADTAVIPQPLAPVAQTPVSASPAFKPAPKLRLPAPTVSQTRLVRQADGSLRMQCDQVPNPKARVPLPVHAVTQPGASQ
jgi:hypothetical protein